MSLGAYMMSAPARHTQPYTTDEFVGESGHAAVGTCPRSDQVLTWASTLYQRAASFFIMASRALLWPAPLQGMDVFGGVYTDNGCLPSWYTGHGLHGRGDVLLQGHDCILTLALLGSVIHYGPTQCEYHRAQSTRYSKRIYEVTKCPVTTHEMCLSNDGVWSSRTKCRAGKPDTREP